MFLGVNCLCWFPKLFLPIFFLQAQKNKVTSVDAPEKHHVLLVRIVKCQIIAYTDDLWGGIGQGPV